MIFFSEVLSMFMIFIETFAYMIRYNARMSVTQLFFGPHSGRDNDR